MRFWLRAISAVFLAVSLVLAVFCQFMVVGVFRGATAIYFAPCGVQVNGTPDLPPGWGTDMTAPTSDNGWKPEASDYFRFPCVMSFTMNPGGRTTIYFIPWWLTLLVSLAIVVFIRRLTKKGIVADHAFPVQTPVLDAAKAKGK